MGARAISHIDKRLAFQPNQAVIVPGLSNYHQIIDNLWLFRFPELFVPE
jgi:hypothetical protein